MIVGKRGLDERLTTTQILLQQREEVVRRGDRERRALTDRVKELERALQASEMDKKHTQVRTHLSTYIHTPCICIVTCTAVATDHHMAALNSRGMSRTINCQGTQQ